VQGSHRGSCSLWSSTICIALAALFAAAPASALTLRHRYEFDAARLGIVRGPAAARVVAADLPATWEAGRPELPYDIVTFLVPRGSRLAGARVQESEEVVLADGLDLMAATPMLDDEGVPLDPLPPRLTAAAFGLDAAGRGAIATGDPGPAELGFEARAYPAILAEPAGMGFLHGYQLLSVRVYPVRHEATLRRVVVHTGLELEIELESGGALPIERQRYSAAIEARARRTIEQQVVNPEALDAYDRPIGRWVEQTGGGFRPTEAPSLEGSAVDGVIITSEALAPAWQTLADWKTRRGVPTVVRTLEWIEGHYLHGSDLQETIRTFVRDAYLRWGVQYVLLAGDTDVVPARYGFSAFSDLSGLSIPTDMYFACLDGNWNLDGDSFFGEAAISVSVPGDSTDLYAEVFVGRAPVSTPAEAAASAGKVIQYENSPVTNYQQRYLMLGEVLFPIDWSPGDPITVDGGSYSEEMLPFTGACLDTIRLYQNYTAFPGAEPLSRSRAL
jgi:hypothetical protein